MNDFVTIIGGFDERILVKPALPPDTESIIQEEIAKTHGGVGGENGLTRASIEDFTPLENDIDIGIAAEFVRDGEMHIEPSAP